MKVIIRNPQRRELAGGKRVEQLLTELRLNPETVIVVREGELLTKDEFLSEADAVEIISAISGG